MRKILNHYGLTFWLLTIALLSCLSAVDAQTQKIRISLSSRSNTNTTYYVAQARGIFKDEGLEVEFIQFLPLQARKKWPRVAR